MKTQILTLESHDDLISVRDRLTWAKTPRVLLVWPRFETVTLRPLDLKVLQRHAASLGAQLGLVTRRKSVQREAEALGIPVFDSTAAAQKGEWPERVAPARRGRRAPRRDLRELRPSAAPDSQAGRPALGVRLALFVLGVAAVLAVGALFVPRAVVTLTPESQMQSLVVAVTANPEIESVFVTGSVPARVQSVVVEGQQTIPIIGQITLPQTRARGIARFQNLTEGEVPIPAGTVLSTLGATPVRFVTLNPTRLTAGIGQIVEVPIEALGAGAAGNLPANALQAIESAVGLAAVVTNPEPTGGGSDRTAIGASEADRQGLRETLLRSLSSQAVVNLQGQAVEDDLLLLDTLTVSQTLEETFSPPLDQAGTSLSLNLRLEFAVQVVSMVDLRRLAASALDSVLPAGYTPEPDSLTIESVSPPDTAEDGTTHWEIKADRRLVRLVDQQRVLNLVRGRTPESARGALAALELQQQPQIELQPEWWPWLPLIPFRISVVTQ
jgi:hypothetical protein